MTHGRPIPVLEPNEEVEDEAATDVQATDDGLATQAAAASSDEPEEEKPATPSA